VSAEEGEDEKPPLRGIAVNKSLAKKKRIRLVAYVSVYAKQILEEYARARNGSLGTAIEILAKEHAADDPLAARERDRAAAAGAKDG
jgi:hypothetical protein